MKKANLIIGMALAAGLLISSCTKENHIIIGEGPVVTETLDLEEFSKITMNGAEKVYITYGTDQEVKVTGHGNIIDRIKTRVSNETWTMELEHGVYGNYHLSYEITLPGLEKIVNNGASDIEVYEFIPQEEFTVIINGAGNFKGFNLP